MAGWNDAYCVRYLKTFQAMPLSSKLMDHSLVLSPLCLTWVAYRGGFFGADELADVPILAHMWLYLAGLYWLSYTVTLTNYLRGYFAQRRGVLPAKPGRKPQLAVLKAYLVTFGVMFVVFTLAMFYVTATKHHTTHHTGTPWGVGLFMLAMFFQQLSQYTRSRYWNIPLEQQATQLDPATA